jgi:hypothetical protein
MPSRLMIEIDVLYHNNEGTAPLEKGVQNTLGAFLILKCMHIECIALGWALVTVHDRHG